MVSDVWHMRNIRQHYSHETVSGPKEKVNVAISFDSAGGAVNDAQLQISFSAVDNAIC